MNKKIELCILRCAKSNGTIHFVLYLKLDKSISFSVDPLKPYIFYVTRFIYSLEKNLHKQKQFLERFSSCIV